MPRVFEVVTKDIYLDEDRIKIGLAHRTIKKWAYILHDKDIYTQEDEDKQRKNLKDNFFEHAAYYNKTLEEFLDFIGAKEPEEIEQCTQDYHDRYENIHTEDDFIAAYLTHIAGTPRPAHWHVVIKTDRNENVETIAKWFDVPSNQIDIPKGGEDAFYDKVEYITHEHPKQQALGKYLYPDDEIKANFDFRKELNDRAMWFVKYGKKKLSAGEKLLLHVLDDGWTRRQCEEADKIAYLKIASKIPLFRYDYLSKQPPVPLRINIYIDGNSGLGKTTFSEAIASSIFQGMDNPYFVIGNDERVTFDGYDGEPCIIWNDMRVTDFIKRFSPQGTYKILDSHPNNEAQQVKNSKVILRNSINIINGIQPYEEFIAGLAGTYKDRFGNDFKAEDETQAWRRFPMILCIREDDFDILLNKGFVDKDLSAVKTMMVYNNVRGSFKALMENLGGAAKEIVVGNMTKPVTDAYNYLVDQHDNKIIDAAAIPEEFSHYGESIPPEERKAMDAKKDKELHEEYQKWLDEIFFVEHPNCQNTDNHPTFDWWLEKVKHII